jgi:transposase
VGRSPNGDQRCVLADPVRPAMAGRATGVRTLEDVYNRHRRWSGDGTWVGVLNELRRDADAAEGPGWTVGIDPGVVRAHQHAAGARHQPPADVAAEVVVTTELDTGGRVE